MKTIDDVLNYLRQRRDWHESVRQHYRDIGLPSFAELPLQEVAFIIAAIEASRTSPERSAADAVAAHVDATGGWAK